MPGGDRLKFDQTGADQYTKVILTLLEQSQNKQESLETKLGELNQVLTQLRVQNEERNRDLMYLVKVIRDGNGSGSLLMKVDDHEKRLKVVEDSIKEKENAGRENAIWMRTSVVALVAGCASALWEIFKYFWLHK